MKKFSVGDKVRVIDSYSNFNGKTGIIRSIIRNGCYRISGLNPVDLVFFGFELENVVPDFYSSAEEIVNGYKSGELQKNYPVLFKAIKMLISER